MPRQAGTWSEGDAVVVRYVEPWGPISGFPVRVVQDGAEGVVLHLAADTEAAWPYVAGRHIRESTLEERYTTEWQPGPHRWEGGRLLFVFPAGRAYGLWLFFGPDDSFERWYVNLQAPFRRTPIGFDTRDHTLDLWAYPDGSHAWKDEDELEVAVRHGHHSAADAAAFRAEGERVLADWPFPTGWEDWRPDPSWAIPSLPDGWDRV